MTWGERVDELHAALEASAAALDRAGGQMGEFGFAKSSVQAHDAARAARAAVRSGEPHHSPLTVVPSSDLIAEIEARWKRGDLPVRPWGEIKAQRAGLFDSTEPEVDKPATLRHALKQFGVEPRA